MYFITVNKYQFCISVIGYINIQIIGIGYKISISVDHYSSACMTNKNKPRWFCIKQVQLSFHWPFFYVLNVCVDQCLWVNKSITLIYKVNIILQKTWINHIILFKIKKLKPNGFGTKISQLGSFKFFICISKTRDCDRINGIMWLMRASSFLGKPRNSSPKTCHLFIPCSKP